MSKRYLTPQEAADVLGLTVHALAQQRYHGRGIPYVKLGKLVRYDQRDIDDYMESHKITLQPTEA